MFQKKIIACNLRALNVYVLFYLDKLSYNLSDRTVTLINKPMNCNDIYHSVSAVTLSSMQLCSTGFLVLKVFQLQYASTFLKLSLITF